MVKNNEKTQPKKKLNKLVLCIDKEARGEKQWGEKEKKKKNQNESMGHSVTQSDRDESVPRGEPTARYI